MKKQPKVESLQEFMARGGTVTKLSYQEPKPQKAQINPSNAGPAVLLTLSEADLFYGEAKVKKKSTSQPKSKLKIDIDMLPAALRAKFLAKALEEAGQDEEKEQG